LTEIYCAATFPPIIGAGAFAGKVAERQFYVPESSVDVYCQAKGWKSYAESIVGYNFNAAK
jgi:hypothetical protein